MEEKKSISEIIIDNKDLIYPALFYIGGLVLGAFLYKNSGQFADLMKKAFELKNEEFINLFLNRFGMYISVFSLTVLLGLCLIGFPFINLIPLFLGIIISFKAAYYYSNYSGKGIAFSILMIAPEAAAFLTILIFAIRKSTDLSRNIYNSAIKKSDMLPEIEMKAYLKSFLLYGLGVAGVSAVNATGVYFLSSIIKL